MWDARAQFGGQGVPRNHRNRPLAGTVETWASKGFLPALWVTLERSPRPQSSYLEGHHQLLQLGIPLLRKAGTLEHDSDHLSPHCRTLGQPLGLLAYLRMGCKLWLNLGKNLSVVWFLPWRGSICCSSVWEEQELFGTQLVLHMCFHGT